VSKLERKELPLGKYAVLLSVLRGAREEEESILQKASFANRHLFIPLEALSFELYSSLRFFPSRNYSPTLSHSLSPLLPLEHNAKRHRLTHHTESKRGKKGASRRTYTKRIQNRERER
jgi:hypothetical protein